MLSIVGAIPSRRHSSEIAISPRSLYMTIRIFSSAVYFLRVFWRIFATTFFPIERLLSGCLTRQPSRNPTNEPVKIPGNPTRNLKPAP